MRVLIRTTVLLMALVWAAGCSGPEEKKVKFFSRGQALYERKDYVKAGLELKNALQIDPKFADAYHLLGMVELKQGDIKQAMGHFGKAVELDPGQINAQLQLGKILLGARLPEKAAEKAATVLARAPGHQGALLLQSAVLVARKQFDEARQILNKLVAADYREVDVYLLLATGAQQQGEPVAAYDVIDQGLAKMPDAAALLLKKAEIEQQTGNSAEAARLVRQVWEKDPENKRLPLLLAELLMADEKPAEAEQTVEKYVAANADDEERRLQAVQFYLMHRQVEKAEKLLERGLEIHGQSAKLYLAMADIALMKEEKAASVLRILEAGVAAIDDPQKPGTLELKNRLARIHLQNGDLGTAEKIVDEVFAAAANNVDAHFTKGNLRLMRGEGAAAVADFRTVVNERPESEVARMRLAEAHLLNQENSLALDTLRQGLQVLPESRMLPAGLARFHARQGNFDQARATLQTILDKHPEDVEIRLELATYYAQDGQRKNAEELLTRIVGANPELPVGYLRLAELQQQAGHAGEARANMDKALALRPDDSLLAAAMVKLLLQQKDQPAALAFTRERVERNPQEPMHHNLLAEVLMTSGDLDKAKASFEKAVALAPGWPLPYNHLAEIYLARGDFAAAEKTFTQAIDVNPDNPGAYLALSHIRHRNGDSVGAIKLLEDAMKVRPDFWQGANDLAFLLVERDNPGDLDRALNLAMRAQSFRPEDASIRDTLGWIYFKKGRLADAKRQLEAAMAKTPESPEVNFHMGMFLLQEGDHAQARRFLEKSLADKGDFQGRDLAEKALGNL